MIADPLALLEAETARANADHYLAEARAALADGQIAWAMYFLDAAETYVSDTSPERIALLLGALDTITERTADRA
jgi:outer membrane PBP1 activator LpoA protein